MLPNISKKRKVLGKSESIINESMVTVAFSIYIYTFNSVSFIIKPAKVSFLKIRKLKH